MSELLQQANERVDTTPELQPYRDLLVDYEWDNQEEHLHWVLAAPLDEIISWARIIRKGEHELLY